jgi:hypothetical protein
MLLNGIGEILKLLPTLLGSPREPFRFGNPVIYGFLRLWGPVFSYIWCSKIILTGGAIAITPRIGRSATGTRTRGGQNSRFGCHDSVGHPRLPVHLLLFRHRDATSRLNSLSLGDAAGRRKPTYCACGRDATDGRLALPPAVTAFAPPANTTEPTAMERRLSFIRCHLRRSPCS